MWVKTLTKQLRKSSVVSENTGLYCEHFYSPALKKWGLYWICLAFCHSVILWLSFCHSVTFQMKIFVTLFSGTERRRRLKLGTHADNERMHGVYRNHAATFICPFIFSFFFSLQFSSIKNFCGIFSGTESLEVETSYKHLQWVVVLCIPESGCCCLFIPLVLHYTSGIRSI